AGGGVGGGAVGGLGRAGPRGSGAGNLPAGLRRLRLLAGRERTGVAGGDLPERGRVAGTAPPTAPVGGDRVRPAVRPSAVPRRWWGGHGGRGGCGDRWPGRGGGVP